MTKRVLRAYAFTTVFCTCIALLLWKQEGESLFDNLVFSFSIGLSICTTCVFFWHVMSDRFPRAVPSIVLPVVGLGVGLLLAGFLTAGNPILYFSKAPDSLLIGIFFGVIGSTIYVSHMRLLEMKAELALAAVREAEQAQQTAETQLSVLQAQIEPHFLINTLSNIHSLIDNRPDDAQETLENLTILLRRSLSRTRNRTITLIEEVDILRAYLDIQKIRMEERLDYSIDVPDSLYDCHLPPLLLQPLVENAVIHGLHTVKGGRIAVNAMSDDSSLRITVADNGVGIDANSRSSRNGHGTGLANVRSRLNHLYGDKASLIVDSQPSQRVAAQGVTSTILLPLQFD